MKCLKARKAIGSQLFLRNHIHGKISYPILRGSIQIHVLSYQSWKKKLEPRNTYTNHYLKASFNRMMYLDKEIKSQKHQIDILNGLGKVSEFRWSISDVIS